MRRVEVALLAGQPLVDRVGDDVAEATPVVGRGRELLAVELLAGEHVPQANVGAEPAVRLPVDASDHERLRVDRAPVGKARHRVEVGDFLDIGGGIDRREQARALQVGGDDLRHAAGDRRIGEADADEIRHRDRQRLHVALRDVEAEHGIRRARREADQTARGQRSRPAARTRRRLTLRCRRCFSETELLSIVCSIGEIARFQPRIMSRGSKVISMSFHCS